MGVVVRDGARLMKPSQVRRLESELGQQLLDRCRIPELCKFTCPLVKLGSPDIGAAARRCRPTIVGTQPDGSDIVQIVAAGSALGWDGIGNN